MKRENTEKQMHVVKKKILGIKVVYHHDQKRGHTVGTHSVLKPVLYSLLPPIFWVHSIKSVKQKICILHPFSLAPCTRLVTVSTPLK